MHPAPDRPGGLPRPPSTGFAHRGGAATPGNEGLENTLHAFADAVARGFRHLETDVHASADGTVHLHHDATMLRTTGDPRRLADLHDDEIRDLRVSGREPVPTLVAALRAFPDAFWSIDVKADSAVEPVATTLEAEDAVDRVCLASFSHRRIRRIRSRLPAVRTAASRREVATLMVFGARLAPSLGWRADTLHVPVSTRGVPVLTDRLVRGAHALGVGLHVWTVDEPAVMRTLLDRGVDGIFTDRTDLLAEVLDIQPTEEPS